jgi:L-amino acid N-acyltransferase YncA
METIDLVKMDYEHGKEIMDIFNYYIENSFAAYPSKKMPQEYYGKIIEVTNGYPAYTIKLNNKIVGFCFIRAYNPFSTFKETAEISYFISKEYSGKGLGKMALDKLEQEGKKMGVRKLLANISSENVNSLSFHRKYGFKECGRLTEVGEKFGKKFDIIWMEKKLN